MPRGVTDQFLKILREERAASLRTVLFAALLALPTYFLAELTDQPLFGAVVMVAFAALLAGLGAGVLLARWRTSRYNASLKDGWNAWMRASLASRRVADVARRVQGKPERPAIRGAASGILVVANGVLFVALWLAAPWAFAFGLAVSIVNGLTLGVLAGEAAWSFRWVSGFAKALDELVAEGGLGIWGEV